MSESPAVLPASLLHRELNKPAAEWTVDDLVRLFEARRLRQVSLVHVGGDGWPKTLDFVPHSRAHLVDVLEGGERADGSSLFVGMGISHGASDIFLRPRPSTAFLDPFASEPSLALLSSHFAPDGAPLDVSPDTIVRRAHARLLEEAGIDLWAHGEVEYFLGRRRRDADIWAEDDRGYHASSPFVFGEALRRRALVLLAQMGLPVKYAHSEVGYIQPSEADPMVWEQHEIELALAPLPQAADGVVLTQWVLRNLAAQEGMRCSFEPVVKKGHAGSGLHFHLAPRVGGEERSGRDSAGALFDESRWLIGGLAALGGALMAFGNREPASLVRLLQAKEAPTVISWGEMDRQALIRLPKVARTASGRPIAPSTIEFRLPDGSVHPHLLLAGVAQALMHGRGLPELEALLARTEVGATTPRLGADRLPLAFDEIAAYLTRDRTHLESGGVFPPALIDGTLSAIAALD